MHLNTVAVLISSCIFVVFQIQPVYSDEKLFLTVTLYDNQNKQGPSLTLDVKGCQNLPGEWNDRASSLDLQGTCLRLYRDQDCTGRMLTVGQENRLEMSNLKKMGFNDMLSSVSSCRPESPKLHNGRYAIQSILDKRVLTVRRLFGGYTMLKTEPWKKDPSQQWDAEKNEDETFWLTPRVFENNPVTYNIHSSDSAPTERVNWVIEGLNDSIYMIKKHLTTQCLTMRFRMESQLKECRADDKRQHWVFHRLVGGSEEQ